MTPEHKAKMAAGRARAKAAKDFDSSMPAYAKLLAEPHAAPEDPRIAELTGKLEAALAEVARLNGELAGGQSPAAKSGSPVGAVVERESLTALIDPVLEISGVPEGQSPPFIWPAEAKLYIEGYAMNPKLMLARLYEVSGGQQFKRVSVWKDRSGRMRPGATVQCRLDKPGPGNPIYIAA